VEVWLRVAHELRDVVKHSMVRSLARPCGLRHYWFVTKGS